MLQRLLSATAARVDRAVSTATVGLLSRHRVATLSHDERVAGLRALAERYGDRRFVDEPDTFFTRLPAPSPAITSVDEVAGLDVEELRWPSAYAPFDVDIREKYLRDERNATAWARVYSDGEHGRPAMILVHGYLCGQWGLEEKLWPLRAFARWGFDVAIIVLPFHAVRSASMARPRFPGADPRFNVEGFRQSVQDVRALGAWLRERGAPAVGLVGMSLGGYVSALCATLDPWDFCVPMIPLGSIADFARDGGRLGGTPDERYEQHRWMEATLSVVSPLSRPSRVPPGATLVIAGHGDRITPVAHAERLAEHLGSRVHEFHGGHLLQFGRGHGFRAVGAMLDRIGLRHRHTADA